MSQAIGKAATVFRCSFALYKELAASAATLLPHGPRREATVRPHTAPSPG